MILPKKVIRLTIWHYQAIDSGPLIYISSIKKEMVIGAKTMEIVQHRPSDQEFQPAIFQSQVQRSTN